MTILEKRLIFSLADMVKQDFEHTEEYGYETGFIGVHKEVLMLLVEVGVMYDTSPENNFGVRWERLFYAKFKPKWEWELRDRK